MLKFVSARSAVSPLALTVATASFLAIGALGTPAARAQTNTNSTPASAAAPAASAPAAERTPMAHKGKLHHAVAAHEATSMRPSSVERRIGELKSQLKITANEESDWTVVADAMRQNAKDMQQLVQQTRSEGPRDKRTALQDLQTYAKFADAHADGLKRLTSAFETLYNAMPAEQQQHADAVFRSFERRRPSSRS
jgi:hypothetical protein